MFQVSSFKFQERAFTLLEMLIAIAIFALVIVAIFNIVFFGQRLYSQGGVRAELLQNGRVVLERMAREIRQSKELVTVLDPPSSEIEFEDGHSPSPYEGLGSDYYYIRYYLSTSTQEVYRQYRVYCFDPCETCDAYFRWNDEIVNGETIYTHACNLEEKIIGEYISDLNFLGDGLIEISLSLEKGAQTLDLQTEILGRNL